MFEHEFDKKQIQTALPDYEYIRKLGSGAIASVHLVKKLSTDEECALKRVSCSGLGEYEKAGAANQARILSSLQHKNVIKVNSCIFDNNEDILYIFMEFAESGDLAALIDQAKEKKKRIPETTVWKVILDVAEALRYLHQSQVIHRDIKPANIFRMGKVFKVGDLNVSKVVKAGLMASTKTGSPLYTAPEVWNQQQYNHQCDIWSLGVLTYELCCLKVPYEAQSIIELTRKIQEQKIKSISTFYSGQLDQIVKKMLDKKPNRRITSDQIIKIASLKLKMQTEAFDQEGVDQLMSTIVFPDTHQRWVNLIPTQLPPKLSNKDSIKEQVIQGRNKSGERNKSDEDQGGSSNGFVRPPNPLSSRSRGKAQNKQIRVENKNQFRSSNLPPIYRTNSPQLSRKLAESKQRSIEKRERSTSRTKRQSAIQLVIQTKSAYRKEDE